MQTHTLGPNQPLIGADADNFSRNVATPALAIDRARLLANIAAMQQAATAAGVGLRPHMKAHKSTHIAKLQRDAGAIGLSCATAKEAEVAATAGIGSILVTTPIASPMVLDSMAAIARSGIEFIMAIDTAEGADRLARAAGDTPIGVLIDLNVGQNRTGVATPEAALALAAHIGRHPALKLRGVQAYYGHLQHVPVLADRRAQIEPQLAKVRTIVDALRRAGHAVEIVSGGGTGTAAIDLASGVFTEIQPGSYLFMDSQYADVERGPIALDFSLALLTRVTSTAVDGQVVIDAGTKALSTDTARLRLLDPSAGAPSHRFMGDEHSALSYAAGAARPPLGTLVRLAATHCDPTVNLHERFHVTEDGKLVEIWPIEARGY